MVRGDSAHRPVFFRLAETSLLLKLPRPADVGADSESDYTARMTRLLRGDEYLRSIDAIVEKASGIPLRRGQTADAAFASVHGNGVRRPVVFEHRGDWYAIDTVDLSGWEPDKDLLPDVAARRAATLLVPKAVNGLNGLDQSLRTVGMTDQARALSITVLASGPNWLVGAACGGDGPCPGGPASRALDVDPHRPPRFRPDPTAHATDAVAQAVTAALGGEGATTAERTGRNVRIAVFDTWPLGPTHARTAATAGAHAGQVAIDGLAAIRAARHRIRPHLGTTPLDQAADDGLVDEAHIYDWVPRTGPATMGLLRWGENGGVSDVESVPDHGLFVADIAKDIAPDAEIHVHRVLPDTGLTDAHLLVEAVKRAIEQARNDGVRLVLNLSLGLAPPLDWFESMWADVAGYFDEPLGFTHELRSARLSDDQFRTRAELLFTPAPLDEWVERLRGGAPSLLPLAPSMALIRSLARANNVLAVAAAGNDALGSARRPLPRMPALSEGVLGVSAWTVDGTAWSSASYSNLDDQPFTADDGAGAFGGALDANGAADARAGMVGVYASDRIPADGAEMNDTGLASWAGTSFATPVAAGLAACIWSARPELSADEVLAKVVALCRDGNGQRRPLPFVRS